MPNRRRRTRACAGAGTESSTRGRSRRSTTCRASSRCCDVSTPSVELAALGFQAALTALLALVYCALWRQSRRPYFATWAAAWGVYAVRLGCISAFLVTRRDAWLFAHQAAT